MYKIIKPHHSGLMNSFLIMDKDTGKGEVRAQRKHGNISWQGRPHSAQDQIGVHVPRPVVDSGRSFEVSGEISTR